MFVHSTQLLKLYFFNASYEEGINQEANSRFKNKPKIPYTIFTKLNVDMMNNVVELKVKKDQIALIDFFYTYSLFVSTDAEMFSTIASTIINLVLLICSMKILRRNSLISSKTTTTIIWTWKNT